MEEDTTSSPGTSGVKVAKKPKAEKKTDKNAAPKGTEQKTSTIDQVCEAIENLGLPKKGASAQAIKKYILSKHEESEHGRVNNQIKKAFAKGIENGVLVRPVTSKDSVGATGRFLVAKKTVKKDSKKSEAKRAKTETGVSDSETTKPDKTVRKRNTSDGAVKDPEKIGKPKSTVSKSKPLKTKPVIAKKPKKDETKTVTKRNEARKDASDSEVEVKKKGRKSVKSYSSDTELMDFVERKTEKITVRKKSAAKGTDSNETEPSSNKSKAKGNVKLYSSMDDKEKKGETKTKTEKKRTKKEN